MAHRPGPALRLQTSAERLVHIRGDQKAALLAWADLDRFEVLDVSTDDLKGWAAVGAIPVPFTRPWPPRPKEIPKKAADRVVATRIYVNCRSVTRLEQVLERVFSDDTRFVETGLRPQNKPQRPGSARERLTCPATFSTGEDGRPAPDSFGYLPLIDFAKYLQKHARAGSMRQVIRDGLARLDDYEERLQKQWYDAVESSSHLSVEKSLETHLRAVGDDTDDPHRYLSVWCRPGGEPPGLLPAFFRADLTAAATGPTSRLLQDFLVGRPGATPKRAEDVYAPETVGLGLVEPSALPASAWASSYLPRFSQQVALGGLLASRSRITAVNGPPGTGKTTLLRDVYAEMVAERALVMVGYADPRTAFGEPIKVLSAVGPTRTMHSVDSQLAGFEMLVASSNNAAVQNVSTVLPALDEIGPAYKDRLRYFRSETEPGPSWQQTSKRGKKVADTQVGAAQPARSDHAELAAGTHTEKPVMRPGLLPNDRPAWGLAAAALGRRDLVSHFGEVIGRFFTASERGGHLLGQLHGGGTLDGWRAAQAQFRVAVQAFEKRLADLEEQRGRQGGGGTGALGRLLGQSPPAPHPNADPRRWGRWDPEPELGTAWVDAEMQRLRVEVFIAAMVVHEQFIRRAGEAMNDNLRLWLALQAGDIDPQHAAPVTVTAWQSFFLLVPLASTTFASMHRLLAHVPAGSLGWLVVDEAGQAIPGAAAGGLARFRRTVIVGDPLQLEPVVTLPRQLVEQLVENQSAPPEVAPHQTSVQQMADAVTPWGTRRGQTWVGLPLLAHNRCQKPMFSIANKMAYRSAMVQGRVGKEAAGLDGLGPSRWIDLPRTDGEHFRTDDAVLVEELLARLPWGTSAPVPSIAVISPFRQVIRELSPRIARRIRDAAPRGLTPEQQNQMLANIGVGTVHTFQGQEYDVVILVLGGGSGRARSWVAETPNLLNVAVTRAKDRLYVIGDHEAWSAVGYARFVADGLPRVPAGPPTPSAPNGPEW